MADFDESIFVALHRFEIVWVSSSNIVAWIMNVESVSTSCVNNPGWFLKACSAEYD